MTQESFDKKLEDGTYIPSNGGDNKTLVQSQVEEYAKSKKETAGITQHTDLNLKSENRK